jgi:hypothetical protein
MAEGTPSTTPTERHSERQSDRHRPEEATRGERPSGPREGGFRIRLSDNEMRSARALQEALGLRSTVAVLGFALRTLGQQLEEGKLDELVTQQRAQMGSRGPSGASPSEGRRERPEGRGTGGGGRWQEGRGAGGRGARVDPFARPAKPAVAPETADHSPAETLPTGGEMVEVHAEPGQAHVEPIPVVESLATDASEHSPQPTAEEPSPDSASAPEESPLE